MNQETKICQNCKNKFTIEPDDFAFYEKMDVPAPTFCPDCRRQRRLSWRNDYVFYNRGCDFCKRKIISLYSPDNKQVIYCNKCWWSDKWDPKAYARDFDFTKPFFEQFAELRQEVPALALVNDNGVGSVNCEYVQNVQYSKNCYMAMVSWKIENCMYFSYGADAKDAVDCMGIFGTSGGIYETLYSDKCFGSRNIQNSISLIDCAYCYDCRGCDNCFQCVGLRHKKYYIKNKKYSKEEYSSIIKKYKLDTWSGNEKARKEFEKFLFTQPIKHAFLMNCVDCIGNNLVNSKNSKYVFNTKKSENCKYLENGDTETDSYDLCVGGELSECYEGLTPDHSNRALFTSYVWKSTNVLYSDFCMSSRYCFGCVGLKFGENSIFNKEYSKEEYKALKAKIIDHMKKNGEWGKFFPIHSSPFAYNETMAQLSFPMTETEAVSQGLRWQKNIQQTKGKTTLTEIPDSIFDVSDSIIDETLECLSCERNYKIIPQELTFYRKWKIPVPQHCFYCRLARRFNLRGPSKLWHRTCQCAGTHSENKVYENTSKSHQSHEPNEHCPNEFETSYDSNRKEIVYCEACYQSEVM